MTIRKQLIELMSEHPRGVRELSQAVHITEKEVYGHLQHIDRTLRSSGKRLIVTPAECLHCGFIFKDRKKYTPPGHCPKCRRTHIQRPSYGVG